MAETYQSTLYSELFNDSIDNDDDFYKSIFVTPIAKDLLTTVLNTNTEAIVLTSEVSDKNLLILSRIYFSGLKVLAQATNYHPLDVTKLSNEKVKSIVGISKQNRTVSSEKLFDDESGDITELNGNVLKNTSKQTLNEFDDGDDLTTLSGGRQGSQDLLSNNPGFPLKDENAFSNLSEKDRIDLIGNVLKIFQVWFQNLIDVDFKLEVSQRSSGIQLKLRVFEFCGENSNGSFLIELFTILKSFLATAIKEIEDTDLESKFISLSAIKESINLLKKVFTLIFLDLDMHKKGDNEFKSLVKLLLVFFEVDFADEFWKLIKLTSPDLEDNNYKPPKIVLSLETMSTFYLLMGVLANTPSSLFSEGKRNADITTFSVEMKNPYKSYFSQDFKWDVFNQQVNLKLLPLFCVEFNYCYNFRPDLVLEQIQNSSLINWISGNRLSSDIYVNCLTSQTITNLEVNKKLSVAGSKSDLYCQELNKIYNSKIQNLQAKQSNEEMNLDLSKIFPVFLHMYTFAQNSSFNSILTTQQYHFYDKIDDRTDDELNNVELFEVWVCLLSYVFEYQYRSTLMQDLTQLALSTLLTLPLNNLVDYQINEYKWKLCHQKMPFVPLDLGAKGHKPSIFYILDTVQNLLRFNLTNRLHVVNLSMGLNLMYNILDHVKADSNIELDKYSWDNLFLSLFGLIKFIKKQNLLILKYINHRDLGSLTEECFLVLNLLLDTRFSSVKQVIVQEKSSFMGLFDSDETRSINYALIYNILLNFEVIQTLINEFGLSESEHLTNLFHCMEHFDKLFYLTEDSKKERLYKKTEVLDFDFDSPEFVAAINSFTDAKNSNQTENSTEGTQSPITYQYNQTLKYSLKQKQRAVLDDQAMFSLIHRTFFSE